MGVPFWATNTQAGYFGPIYPVNPVDLCILGGEKLPGICTVKALPSQEISREQVPGRDGATILWKGYVPGPIDLQCLMWLKAQWDLMQVVLGKIWQKPGKELAGKGFTKKQKAKLLDKQAEVAERAAMDIAHPYLQVLCITRVILVGVSLPEDGPAPQSRIISFKLLEYVPPGKKTALKKANGALPTFKRAPELDKAANTHEGPTPGEKEAGPYGEHGARPEPEKGGA